MANIDTGLKRSLLHTQNGCRNADMFRKIRHTGMDGQRKDHPDPRKGTTSNNYRSITGLPIMWKILTVQIREEIYYSQKAPGLFANDQKGCCKETIGRGQLVHVY